MALDGECSKPGVGGCGPSSPRGRWLAADLAAHPTQCTLAYWHRPRWRDNGSVSGTSSWFAEARSTTYGVLALTLHATSYDWSFVPEAGRTFTDSGTQACH